MTSELEQEFFRVFGIEPKKRCFNGDCAVKDEIGYDEKICDDRCVYIDREYPEITDRRLLELILLRATKYMGTVIELKPNSNIKDLKAEILQYFIKYKTEFNKHQIQRLFKGEE